jgi:hypothetical protein
MTDAQLEAKAKKLLGELEEPYRTQALENFDSGYFQESISVLVKMVKVNALLCAFYWRASKQGFDYWNDLYFKLQEEHHSNKAE